MRSRLLGRGTSRPEVSHISAHGFWLDVGGKEYFLPFEEYPWFKRARVSEILDVKLLHKTHLHWPGLDVDLEIESLTEPERYPLVYR